MGQYSYLVIIFIATIKSGKSRNLTDLNGNISWKPPDQIVERVEGRLGVEQWVKRHLEKVPHQKQENLFSDYLGKNNDRYLERHENIFQNESTITTTLKKESEINKNMFERTTRLDWQGDDNIQETVLDKEISEKSRKELAQESQGSFSPKTESNGDMLSARKLVKQSNGNFLEKEKARQEESIYSILDDRSIQMATDIFKSFKECVRTSLENAHNLINEIRNGAGGMFHLGIDEFGVFIEKTIDFEERCPMVTNILKDSVQRYMKHKLMLAQEESAPKGEKESKSIVSSPIELPEMDYGLQRPAAIEKTKVDLPDTKLHSFIGPLLPRVGSEKIAEANNYIKTMGVEL